MKTHKWGCSSHVITGPTYLIVIQYVVIHMLHVMTAFGNKCKYKYVELKQRNYIQTTTAALADITRLTICDKD